MEVTQIFSRRETPVGRSRGEDVDGANVFLGWIYSMLRWRVQRSSKLL